MTNEHVLDQHASYRIVVKGVLYPSWSGWFDGFTITVQGDETLLAGTVPDQSALHDILAKDHNLGLSLISLNKVPDHESLNEKVSEVFS